ncbi:MAG: sensor histidine kinase [Uliginosibacterium sp.]|jgi:two-component system sensor histidine kinase QseC|nr:sensor histidine kinase [Uliginosibacterium sp.]
MKPVREPSLARRLILVLLGSFTLVCVVLLLKGFYEYKQATEDNRELKKLGESVSRMLVRTDDPAFAAKLIGALEEQYNESRRAVESIQLDPLRVQLYDHASGKLIHASPGLGEKLLPAQAQSVQLRSMLGHPFWVFAADGVRWSVRIAEPKLPDVSVARLMLREMLPDLLLSFPLVFLPVWLAVYRGLHPLRQLARALHARDPDDLSPLKIDLRYRELRPLLDAFDGLLFRLRQKVMQERAFVQDAAHELRTPMAVIGAQAHVLAMAESGLERQDAKLALDRAIARASHLSQQLLSLASLERGTQEAEVSANLPGLVQGILAQFAPAAISREVDLALEAPEELNWRVKIESFQSILHNLIDNALRYGRVGGQVVVSLEETADSIQLSVADDGPGIPLAEHARVFERFYRGGGQDISGTGLGLAIVKKAAMNLGGTVNVAAGLNGQGVAFVITLPRAEQPSRA